MTAPYDVQPQSAEERHRSVLVIVGALMLAMLLAALDQTIVATALPTIAADLHGLNHLSWVVTAYLLTSTVSTPLWGKLGDLYGRKKLFQAAIVIFLVGSALSGLSTSMVELIGFRALQGVGAGGLIVGAMSIVGDVVSPRERGRYQGYFGAVFGVSSIAGPLLGGFFTDHLTWRWVFYINLPIGVVALFVVAAVLHLPKRSTEHRIDYLGTLLLGTGVTALILLTTWGGTTYPWSSAPVIILAVLGVLLLVAFVVVERRTPEPVLPPELFRDPVFSIASVVGFIVGFAMFGAIVYLPTFLQYVRGASPTLSGLQLIPVMAGMLGTSIVTGQLISRWGRYRIFPILGTLVMTLGLFLLSRLQLDTPFALMALYMALVGVGLGGVMQVLVIAVQNAVPYRHLGTATSAATFFRAIGGSFGVATFGALFNHELGITVHRYLPAPALRMINPKAIATNPAALKHLPPAIHHGLNLAFTHALDPVFLLGAPVAFLGFLLALFLREVPLRRSAYMAGPEGTADTTTAAVAAAAAPGPVSAEPAQ